MLAIGIVAAALIPLVGMLPIGLTNYRNAMNISIGAQITQQISSELQQTSFTQLNANADSSGRSVQSLRYYNEQGVQVGDATNPPPTMSQVLYQVKVVVQNPSPVLVGSLSTLKSNNLAAIIVDVVRNPGNKSLQTDPGTGGILQEPGRGIYVSRFFAFASQTP